MGLTPEGPACREGQLRTVPIVMPFEINQCMWIEVPPLQERIE